MKTLSILLSFAIGSALLSGQGRLLWDESANGPISETFEAATQFGSLTAGTNSILATVSTEPVGNTWIFHNDYFTFVVPQNYRIEALSLTINNSGTTAWIGNPGFGNPVIGYKVDAAAGNLFDQMSLTSIGAGIYGMYMENFTQQPTPWVANYRLDFVLTAVPEPGTWALLGLGSALLWCATRRRRK